MEAPLVRVCVPESVVLSLSQRALLTSLFPLCVCVCVCLCPSLSVRDPLAATTSGRPFQRGGCMPLPRLEG